MAANNEHTMVVNYDRMPKPLQERLGTSSRALTANGPRLQLNEVHHGDARQLLPLVEPNSVALSVWSPPYFVGKQYESYLKHFNDWQSLLESVIAAHYPAIVPGGFLVVNIADILCFKDPAMPKVQAEADPGDKVLDCFMGSGTTAVAALTEDRLFIGIDIEQKSVTLANRQIKKATPAQLILLKP